MVCHLFNNRPFGLFYQSTEEKMADMMNGVNREALFGTIEAVKSDPDLARFNFRISNTWMGGGLNRTTISDFHGVKEDIPHETSFEVWNDEPEVLLSGDKGPNPVENLLHALAGCLTTAMAYHAAARGIAIDGITTRFEGDLDLRGFLGLSDDVRNGYDGIRVVFDINADILPAQKRELVEMAMNYSPVFDVVTNGTPVTCRITDDLEQDVAA